MIGQQYRIDSEVKSGVTRRELIFDYRWNPILFTLFSYKLWITGIYKAWRKDVAKARKQRLQTQSD